MVLHSVNCKGLSVGANFPDRVRIESKSPGRSAVGQRKRDNRRTIPVHRNGTGESGVTMRRFEKHDGYGAGRRVDGRSDRAGNSERGPGGDTAGPDGKSARSTRCAPGHSVSGRIVARRFADPVVQQWTNYNDSDLTGTVGGVQIGLNGDPATGIYFLIYPDAATGEQYFTANRSSVTVIPTVPSTSANQGERIQLTYTSGAVCVELIANVTVIGAVGSTVQVPDSAKAACDLVDAGITHLDTVTSIQPVPIPAAQVPPSPLDRLNALLATPFPADLLPAGHHDPVTNQWRYGDQDLKGAIGGLNISLDGDQTTGIGYIVFPLADRATAYVSAIGASMGTPVAAGTPVTEFRAALDGYAVCVGVRDAVVIIGARTMADGTSGPER